MALNGDLIRASLALLASRQPMLAPRFYEILFERYPSVRPLFSRHALDEQGRMLQDAIVAVVEHIEDASWLSENLTALGRRHVGYGVTREMYAWVGESWLATFAEIAGQDWTPALERAWSDAYEVIVELMLREAR